MIAVYILLTVRVSAAVVSHFEIAEVGYFRPRREVGHAAAPLDGSFGLIRAAGYPGASLDTHGRLGEVSAAVGVVVEGARHLLAVNGEGNILGHPLDAVCVEGRHGVGDSERAVVDAILGPALGIKVGLDLVLVHPDEFLQHIVSTPVRIGETVERHVQSLSHRGRPTETLWR